MSRETAAELAGVGPTAIAAAVSRGDLHPRHVHRTLPSLEPAEVLAWAEARRQRKPNARQSIRSAAIATGHQWFVREHVQMVTAARGAGVRQERG